MNLAAWKKRLNYRLIEWQKKRRRSVVIGYPYWLTIDPASVCNLRCVFCPTGQRRGARPKAVLPFERFAAIVDKLGPYLYRIDFCNWGEPLLNPDIFRMIAYARRYGPEMKIDTSLNVELTAAGAEALICSGLHRLLVSIDGATRPTYETYRRDGDFERVLRNLALLVDTKKRLRSATPEIHWQFLVFRHNEHEIEPARALARKIGVDSIGFTAPFCAPEWASTKEEYNNYVVADGAVGFKPAADVCAWLWDGLAINADGSVSPCCSVEDRKDDFCDFFSRPFWMLWNGRQYRAARRYVRDRVAPERGNVCTRCDHIGASNHEDVRIRP